MTLLNFVMLITRKHFGDFKRVVKTPTLLLLHVHWALSIPESIQVSTDSQSRPGFAPTLWCLSHQKRCCTPLGHHVMRFFSAAIWDAVFRDVAWVRLISSFFLILSMTMTADGTSLLSNKRWKKARVTLHINNFLRCVKRQLGKHRCAMITALSMGMT